MARSRNVKPGFFRNADLAELPVEARLLFIGLWTIADREGRLEDRPKQIKIEVFPADNFDCEPLLQALADTGMIMRYQAGEKRYLQVTNFVRHQNPHKDEKKSTIPAPCLPGASTVQAPCNSGESTVAIGLIPDSLLLIPDSPGSAGSDADASVVASKLDDRPNEAATACLDCPQQELLALYAEILPTMPQPRVWDGQRAKNLKARWRWAMTAKTPKGTRYATDKGSALDFFRRFFAYVAASDFLTGRDGKWVGCSIAWLVKAENFAKVLEGQYDNRQEHVA